jgi:hypothetical protein
MPPAMASSCPSGFSLVTGTTDVCERIFTATGTTNWTVPAGVTSIDVLVVGAGGRGSGNTTRGGGGGGGGGITVLTGLSTVPGDIHSLSVGAGNVAGNGGDSRFRNTSSTDLGLGAGGRGANSSTGGSGGAGSIAAGVTGSTYSGKTGQNGSSVATPPVEGQLVNDGLFVHDVKRWGGGGGGGGDTTRGDSAGEPNSGGGGGGDQKRDSGNIATAGRAGIVIIRTQLIRSTQTVTWAPTTAITTSQSPFTPSTLASTDGDGAITYSKVSNTSSTCDVNTSTGELTYTGDGNCVVRATAAATATFLEGTTDVTFTISSANQSITAAASPTSLAPGATAALTHSGSSGSGAITWALTSGVGVCTLSITTVTAIAPGLCVLTVTIAADSTYETASSSVTITVVTPGGEGGMSSTPTAAPQIFELSLAPEDGTVCSKSSEAGTFGTWLALPGANDCTPPAIKPNAKLLGWATSPDFPVAIAKRQVDNGWGAYETFNDSGRLTGVFIPAGKAAFLSGPGKLYTIWSE